MGFKDAIEMLYCGKCDIYEHQNTVDPITHITSQGLVKVYEGLPCRLSFYSSPTADDIGGVPKITQTTKLFISPTVEIKPSSVIEVTQNNVTRRYIRSGEPAIYFSHQEVAVEVDDYA